MACNVDPTIATAENPKMMIFENADVANIVLSHWEFNGDGKD